MTKDIRIIGLDLDGTLLRTDKTISPRVANAITRATAAGVVVLPATGRHLTGIPEEVLALPGVGYALSSNGARVVEMPSRKDILTDCFTPEEAIPLLDIAYQNSGIIALYIDHLGYTDADDLSAFTQVLSPVIAKYIASSRIKVPSLPTYVRQQNLPVEKLAFMFANEAARQKAWQELDARGDNCTTSSMEMNLEVNTPTANKGAGLLALAAHLGYTREQVMAVGDSSNDAAMLQTVGYSVAMGNAPPEIQALAHSVTASCDEDGVALAIESILH